MKKILKIVLALAVLLAISAAVALSMVDRIAKAGVEQGGTYALGVKTTLDNISVAVFSGQCKMAGLKVANPEGFESDRFLELIAGQVAVSLGSLAGDTVVAPTLTLTGVDVYMEKRGGRANYEVILENLKKFESKSGKAPHEESGKKFMIERVLIRNINIHIDMPPVNTTIPIEQIGPFAIGTDTDNGALLADVTNTIVKALFKSIVQDLGNVLPDLVDDLGKQLDALSNIGDIGVKIADQVLEKKWDLKKHVEGIKEASKHLDDAGKNLGDMADGLGDLFKNDRGGK